MGLKEDILFLEIVYFFILGEQRSCNGRGGAQRPVLRGNAPKKTGARHARARMRGQNPLVNNKHVINVISISIAMIIYSTV